MNLSEKVLTDFISENTQTTNNSLPKKLQSNLRSLKESENEIGIQTDRERETKSRNNIQTDKWFDFQVK